MKVEIDVPFVLTCRACDLDGPPTMEEALKVGWQNIECDLDGWSWNFLGDCPEHREAQREL